MLRNTTIVMDPKVDECTQSSSSNNSTTTLTPTTDNTAQKTLFSDQQVCDIPESKHQPVLDTIALKPVNNMTQQINSDNNFPSSAGDYGVSSQSIDLMKNVNVNVNSQQQQNDEGRRRRPPQSRSGNHRRTGSEEYMQQHQQYQQQHAYIQSVHPSPTQAGSYQGQLNMSLPPPPQWLPPPRYNLQRQRQPPIQSQQIPTPAHHRIHSLPSFFPPPGISPSLDGFSPVGNPLIPILPDAESLYAASPTQGERKRSNNSMGPPGHRRNLSGNAPVSAMRSHGHRRAHSGNTPGIYGSFDNGTQTRQQANVSFSPRQEIMKLSKGYSSRTPHQQQQIQGLPCSPNNAYTRGGRSPRASPGSSSMRQQGYPPENHHVSFSPSTPIRKGENVMPSLQDMQKWDGQGSPESQEHLDEAVFQANRRGKSRKMHMRQQSAQLFMEPIKGVKQTRACRDVLFVLLFLLQLAGMAYLGMTYGHDVYLGEHAVEDIANLDDHSGLEDGDVEEVMVDLEEDSVAISYRNVIYVTCLCGLFSVAISTLALVIMTMIAKRLVQVSLILTISLSFAWGTIGIGVSPQNVVPITGIIALMLSVGYTFIVWDRIPFAAANLYTGLSGVRANAGTVMIAFAFQGLSLFWTVFFAHVLIGVYNAIYKGDLVLSVHMSLLVYIMLGISYYWTYHVLMNVVQVTVAGTIGNWWFTPDGNASFCKEAVTSSFFSAIFYELGSICFGSLFVGPVTLLHMLASFFRPSSDASVLMCMHEFLNCAHQCISGCCVDQLADHFSPWALTYVGLYGYSLLEAGEHATELFEKRGWTTIVSDDLVPNVLLMVSVVIGGVTGCFGMLVQRMDELAFTSIREPQMTAFLIGLCIGWVVTSILFGIISSSVNAVIVCFAGNPVEFDKNHPQLSTEMRSAWREVWPGCMDVVDMRVEYLNLANAHRHHPDERHPLL